MPTAVAAHNKEGNDIPKFTFAYGASTRRTAGFAMPIVDVYAGAFKKVQRIPAVGACVLLYEAAQDVSALLLDGRKILALGRQQLGILHRGSPKERARRDGRALG
jgi:hypothetical protein